MSKKTERLNEPPPFVNVTDSNIDVSDTFDTVDSVDSFLVESRMQQSSLRHKFSLFLGTAQWEYREEGRRLIPCDDGVPLESFKIQHTVGVVVEEQDEPWTHEIDVKLCY